MRGKAGLNPRVIDAFREDGKRVKSCQDRDFQAIITKLPKKQRGELDVEWLIDHQPFRLRLIAKREFGMTHRALQVGAPRSTGARANGKNEMISFFSGRAACRALLSAQ